MKKVILKVQVPVFTNDPDAGALVYNEDRSIEVMLDIDDQLLGLMNGAPKAYFHALVDPKKGIQFTGEAPWQDW